MDDKYPEVAALDEIDAIIYERSRLKILTILRRTDSSDYLFIRRQTGLSMANLSSHLAKLEEVGLVNLHKHFVGKKPVTNVRITVDGRALIEWYWDQMKSIERRSRPQAPDPETPTAGFGGAAYGGASST